MDEIINNDEFKENGFIVVDLLDSLSLSKLNAVYSVIPINKNQGFYTSLNFEHKHERNWADSKIKKIVSPKVFSFLPNYLPFLGSFTIKKPGETSDLQLHLDWSITDERHHKAIGVWIPLCDTNSENGTLGLLKGSHKFPYSVRGSLVNFIFSEGNGPNILDQFANNYTATEIAINKGQAIIYDLSLAHFSKPNISKYERVAINLIMIPENAETFHFKRVDNEIYKIPITSEKLLNNFLGSEIEIQENDLFYTKASQTDLEEQHLYNTKINNIEKINEGSLKIPYSWLHNLLPFIYLIKFNRFKKRNQL